MKHPPPHFISHPCLMNMSVVLLMVGYNKSVVQEKPTQIHFLFTFHGSKIFGIKSLDCIIQIT